MELIDREELLKDLKTSAIYHANNSREETLMYRDRNIVREQPTVEAIPKADYENRLKADLKAILVELQLEIEGLDNPFGTRISGCSQDGWKHGVKNCDFVIQKKINELEGGIGSDSSNLKGD